MGLNTLLGCRTSNLLLHLINGFEICTLRHGHHLRGLPPALSRTINERLEELNYKDPELTYRVDIGLPVPKSDNETKQEQIDILKLNRKNMNMERESRKLTLRIDLNATYKEWIETIGPKHIKMIADHYGIFDHLYGDAYYYPTVPINVTYISGDIEHPVHYGNIIKPVNAIKKPEVSYASEPNSLWTLIMTNLDGHFHDKNKEYIHWFVCNIQESKIPQGETIVNYLQPFPPRGTGYHRFAFILYKQTKKMDFVNYKLSDVDNLNLEARSFSTLDFYTKYQDYLTPAGLSFFQSHWDNTLSDFYHKVLQMREPIYQYDFNPPYIRPQKWFAKGQPFNLYMDKYRDQKQIHKEFLQRKLKNVHPFKDSPPPIPFPNSEPWSKPYLPSWLKLEITKSRLKWGRINEIE